MKRALIFIALFLFLVLGFNVIVSGQESEESLRSYFDRLETQINSYNSGEISLLQLIIYLDNIQRGINDYFRKKTQAIVPENEDEAMKELFKEIELISFNSPEEGVITFGNRNDFKEETGTSTFSKSILGYGNYNSAFGVKDITINLNLYYHFGGKQQLFIKEVRETNISSEEGTSEEIQEMYFPPNLNLYYTFELLEERTGLEGSGLSEIISALKNKVEISLDDNFLTSDEQKEIGKIAGVVTRNFDRKPLNSYEECIDFVENLGFDWSVEERSNEWDQEDGSKYNFVSKFFKYKLGEAETPWGEKEEFSFTINCLINKKNGELENEGGYLGFEGRNLVESNLAAVYYTLFQKSEIENIQRIEGSDAIKQEISSLKSELENFYSSKINPKSDMDSILGKTSAIQSSIGSLNYDECKNIASGLNAVEEERVSSDENFAERKRFSLNPTVSESLWNEFSKSIIIECGKAKEGSEFRDYASFYLQGVNSLDYFSPYDLAFYIQWENQTEYFEYLESWRNKSEQELASEFSALATNLKDMLNGDAVNIEEFRNFNNKFVGIREGVSKGGLIGYEDCNEMMQGFGMESYTEEEYGWLSEMKSYYYILKRNENRGNYETNWYIKGICGKNKEGSGTYTSLMGESYIEPLDSYKPVASEDASKEEIASNIEEKMNDLISNLTLAFEQGTIDDEETLKSLSDDTNNVQSAFYRISDFSQCNELMGGVGMKKRIISEEDRLFSVKEEGVNIEEYYLTKYFSGRNGFSITGHCNSDSTSESNRNYLNINLLSSIGEPTLGDLGENPYIYYQKDDLSPFYDFKIGYYCDINGLQKNIKLLNKLKEGLNQELLNWYFANFLNEENYKNEFFSGSMYFMWRLNQIEREVAENIIRCSDEDIAEIPSDIISNLKHENLDLSYKQENADAKVWSETIKLGLDENDFEMSFLIWTNFWMPNKENFKDFLVNELVKEMEEETERNKKFAAQQDSDEDEVVRFIADKYGGSLDVKVILFDDSQELITRYFQINPEIMMGLVKEISEHPDVTLEVNYNPLYDLVLGISKSAYKTFDGKRGMGGFVYEIVDLEWEDTRLRIVEEGEEKPSPEEMERLWREYEEERRQHVTVISTSNNDYRQKIGVTEEEKTRITDYILLTTRSIMEFMLNRDSVKIKPSSATLKFYWNLGAFIDFLNEKQQTTNEETQLLEQVKDEVGKNLVQQGLGIQV